MTKKLIYHITGIAIIIFWLIVLMELVRNTGPKNKTISNGSINTNRQASPKQGSEEWMEIIFKGRKIGYTVTKTKPMERGYKVTEEIFMSMDLMGEERQIMAQTRAELNKEFLLDRFDFQLSSLMADVKISGEVEGENLYLTVGEGTGEVKRSIKVPSKPLINAGVTQFFRSRKLSVGDSFTFPLFDPVTMTTNNAVISVEEKGRITVKGKSYRGFRLRMDFLGKPLVIWVDENGVPLKEEGFMGFTLVKSNSLEAKSGLAKGVNFYDLTAVKVAERIRNPRESSYLRIRFKEVPSRLPVDTSRQELSGRVLTVRKEVPPFNALYQIPYADQQDKMSPFLRPEPLVQCLDKDIAALAGDIIKETRDPFAASRRIMQWVFKNLKKIPLLSLPDSKKILENRAGDCNEHATLMTALLRSAGIPSRMVAGLVYKDGRFYYHAWNEAFISGWVSLDATLNQIPVDATHIKLVNGGIERQVEIIGMIGSISFEVLEYR